MITLSRSFLFALLALSVPLAWADPPAEATSAPAATSVPAPEAAAAVAPAAAPSAAAPAMWKAGRFFTPIA